MQPCRLKSNIDWLEVNPGRAEEGGPPGGEAQDTYLGSVGKSGRVWDSPLPSEKGVLHRQVLVSI